MSSASIPAPRTPPPGTTSRRTFFLPILVLLVGMGLHALYQVSAQEDQLDEITRAIDKIDANVKAAQHDKALFYALARDVMNLAPKDPNAEQIVVDFKIQKLKALQPTLFELAPPPPAPDTPTSNVANPGADTTPAQPTELPSLAPTNAPGLPEK
jgi:hypothetical protein